MAPSAYHSIQVIALHHANSTSHVQTAAQIHPYGECSKICIYTSKYEGHPLLHLRPTSSSGTPPPATASLAPGTCNPMPASPQRLTSPSSILLTQSHRLLLRPRSLISHIPSLVKGKEKNEARAKGKIKEKVISVDPKKKERLKGKSKGTSRQNKPISLILTWRTSKHGQHGELLHGGREHLSSLASVWVLVFWVVQVFVWLCGVVFVLGFASREIFESSLYNSRVDRPCLDCSGIAGKKKCLTRPSEVEAIHPSSIHPLHPTYCLPRSWRSI